MVDSLINLETKRASFNLTIENTRCTLEFSIENDTMDIRSVRVPESVGGRGLAGQLTRHALDWAQTQTLKVIPTCPYVASWVQRHPEFLPIIAESSRDRLG